MLLLGGISVTKSGIFDIIGGISYIKRGKSYFHRLFLLLLGGILVTKGDIFDIIGGISYIKRDKTLFRRLFLLLLHGILDIVAINLFMDKNHIKNGKTRYSRFAV